LYIEPADSSKHVAYMEMHIYVRVYMVVYLLILRNATVCPPSGRYVKCNEMENVIEMALF
jgi:hypothetical protein